MQGHRGMRIHPHGVHCDPRPQKGYAWPKWVIEKRSKEIFKCQALMGAQTGSHPCPQVQSGDCTYLKTRIILELIFFDSLANLDTKTRSYFSTKAASSSWCLVGWLFLVPTQGARFVGGQMGSKACQTDPNRRTFGIKNPQTCIFWRLFYISNSNRTRRIEWFWIEDRGPVKTLLAPSL